MPNQDFRDMLFELNAAGVDSLVIGAHAVMLFTEPRFTKALEIFVRASADMGPRVVAALRAFGAPLADVTEADFAEPGITFQLGLAPNRIDLVTEIDGVTFEEAWASKRATTYAGVPIFVPSVEVLIKNKRAAGRPQDLLDVERLLQASSKQ